MTDKELLYVDDALGHEKFLKTCACQTSSKLQDPQLSEYFTELEQTHEELLNKFLSLL